ncbi:MAG TPA: hypothetical protein VGD98_07625 [Ktedonobacteraceae bacterium]
MTLSRRNAVEEQQEAQQKAQQLTAIYAQFNIALDPIDWQQSGMEALVKVNHVEIASLRDLWQRDESDVLRQAQIKLLEHAALKALRSRSGLKVVMWSPVEVVQPQEFLSLWIITFETDERIPIIEFLSDGQRVYAPFQFDEANEQQLAMLFGPAHTGEYYLGETITIKERDHQYTGKIIYILPPSKKPLNNKQASRRYHTVSGAIYTNNDSSRYIVNCCDGFPHIVYQSQIVR